MQRPSVSGSGCQCDRARPPPAYWRYDVTEVQVTVVLVSLLKSKESCRGFIGGASTGMQIAREDLVRHASLSESHGIATLIPLGTRIMIR